jgi:spore germination protein (amino acid permease)
MLKNNDRISSLQMFIIIVSTINAMEVIILPRSLALDVGPDGWVPLIAGHVFSAVALFFIIKLGLLFPDETLAEYAPKILGKILGIPIALFAGVFWMLLAARVVRQFADFIQLILPQVPIEGIILSMLLVAAYIARHGIEPITRTLEILFPIFIGMVAVLFFIVLGSRLYQPVADPEHTSKKTGSHQHKNLIRVGRPGGNSDAAPVYGCDRSCIHGRLWSTGLQYDS